MPVGLAYSARTDLPVRLIRAATKTVRLEVTRDGRIATPSSGTYTLYAADGTKLVDALAVTMASDGAATYTVSATVLPTSLEFSRLLQERWSLVMPDGVTHEFIRTAWLARFELYNPVGVVDLTDEYDDMARYEGQAGKTRLQKKLDAAWRDVQRRLLEEGKDPALVLSPSSLFPSVRHLAASKVYENWAGSGRSEFESAARRERRRYDRAWSKLKLTEDLDEDGLPSADEAGRPGTTLVNTGGGGAGWHGRFTPPSRS